MVKSLKILVVSQKGGVGKSTLSSNLVGWLGEQKNLTTMILDFDPHASSSSWVTELKPKNVTVNSAVTTDFSAQRWFIGARSQIRKIETKVSKCRSVESSDVKKQNGRLLAKTG